MKKLILLVLLLFLVGCTGEGTTTEDPLVEDVNNLEAQLSELQENLNDLYSVLEEDYYDKDTFDYLLDEVESVGMMLDELLAYVDSSIEASYNTSYTGTLTLANYYQLYSLEITETTTIRIAATVFEGQGYDINLYFDTLIDWYDYINIDDTGYYTVYCEPGIYYFEVENFEDHNSMDYEIVFLEGE